MVYKKHREIQDSYVSKIDLKVQKSCCLFCFLAQYKFAIVCFLISMIIQLVTHTYLDDVLLKFVMNVNRYILYG